MRIKKLILENINSLYGKWEIDFDCETFRKSGIFAITGKTGSGKTSILDAICLALYAVTPRLSKGSSFDAVSRGCKAAMCELTFVDTENHEWVATFAYETVKQGANKGETRKDAQGKPAYIHRLSCDGKTVAANTTQVKKMVEEITGLDSERFCRAVLLAQGSFDAFLNAGKDNGEILERITGTEIYSRIAEKLKERYSDEKNKLLTIEAQFSGIVIMSDEEAEKLCLESETLDKEIAGFLTEQNALNQLMQKFQQLELFSRNLEKCGDEEKILAEDETAFSAQKKRFEDGKKVLEADEKFRPYKNLRDQLVVAQTALQKNEQILQEQEKLFIENKQALDAAVSNAEKYAGEFGELSKIFADVNELDIIIKTLDSNVVSAGKKRTDEVHKALNCRRELAEIRRKLAELEKNHSEATAYLAAHAGDSELPAVRKMCEEWLKQLKGCADGSADNKKQSAKVQKELSDLQKLISQKEELLKAESGKLEKISADEARAKQNITEVLAGTAREQWKELYDAHDQLYQQALICKSLEEHRRQLQDGVECPLCGAKEHPFALGNIPEPEKEAEKLKLLKKRLEDIDKAEKTLQQISIELNICRNAGQQIQSASDQAKIQFEARMQAKEVLIQTEQKLQAEFEQTSGKIDDILAPFALSWDKKTYSLTEEFAVRIRKFTGYQAEQTIFDEKLNEFKNSALRLQTALKTLLDSCRALKKDWNQEKAKRTEVNARRVKLFGDKDPAAEAAAAEEKRMYLISRRENAQKLFTEISTNRSRTAEDIGKLKNNITELNTRIISARDNFLFACKSADVTEEEFYTCVLSAEEMTELSAKDAELKSRRKQLTENRQNCEKEIRVLSDFLAGKKDKNVISEELEKVSAQLLEKTQYAGVLKQKIRQDAENKQKMADQHAKLAAQKKIMELWTRLYDLIGVKDRFQRFAQGITLEHLLVLANIELEKLSGRYRLLRSRNEELGIDVADKDQGDEIRSCKTLSGGERFLVSLALALGLAQMAGEKIRVDSLFLDEGFGTLDAETLDTALEALNSLRNRGKLVGVISHVTAFSEKIPCIIEVNKSGGGRSTLSGPGISSL